MSFFGKNYTHEKDENYREFLNTLGIPEENKQAMISLKQSQFIKKDGDGYILSYSSKEGVKELKFKNGVEFVEPVAPGVVAKTTMTVDGNVVTQIQKFDHVVLTIKREFSDDQVVVTITSSNWDSSSRRYYKAD